MREILWILEKSIILPFDVVIESLNILCMVLMVHNISSYGIDGSEEKKCSQNLASEYPSISSSKSS